MEQARRSPLGPPPQRGAAEPWDNPAGGALDSRRPGRAMDFHSFMYVTIGRRHELERSMAGKDPVLNQRMLDRDRCLTTLELFADKVPRFRGT